MPLVLANHIVTLFKHWTERYRVPGRKPELTVSESSPSAGTPKVHSFYVRIRGVRVPHGETERLKYAINEYEKRVGSLHRPVMTVPDRDLPFFLFLPPGPEAPDKLFVQVSSSNPAGAYAQVWSKLKSELLV